MRIYQDHQRNSACHPKQSHEAVEGERIRKIEILQTSAVMTPYENTQREQRSYREYESRQYLGQPPCKEGERVRC